MMRNFNEFKELLKKSVYCSIATIGSDGHPHISPIGSVFLENEERGHFIEIFTKSFTHLEGQYACLMVVNTSPIFWIKSLFKGRFISSPAIRVRVKILAKEKIREEQMARFHKKVRYFKWLKGYQLMWSKADYIRPFLIEEEVPLSIGAMTKLL